MTGKELQRSTSQELSEEETRLLSKELLNVREEVRDDPYLSEALKVLPVKGYRSAIGAYWNAVVDDIRNKIIHRSLDLFNKEMRPKKMIEKYEDFQDHVTEYDLIEGAYKIGVLSWEARKLLHQARETRNIFYGHPKSSDPSLVKVLDLISDCNRYVLSEEYPPSIIDISTYLAQMDGESYDRNELAIEQAFSDLPTVYKSELSNRFYSAYVSENTSTDLRSNIEVCAPILWSVLTKEDKMQLGKRFDKDIVEGNKEKISRGLSYIKLVEGMMYVSTASRRIVFEPVIGELESNLDNWTTEGRLVRELRGLGTNIPANLTTRYVSALTHTFVGYKGSSFQYSRTDFYSNTAAHTINTMFHSFDNAAVNAFVETVRSSKRLQRRIANTGQLARLRILGNILLEKGNIDEDASEFLELLVDEESTGTFYESLRREEPRQKLTRRSSGRAARARR